MPTEIITSEDLIEFKVEIINEMKRLFKEYNGQPTKKWLKSPDVRRILNLSAGTLQNLRLNGSLPFTKIGGVIYYDFADIQALLQSKKQNFHNH
jgi:hypothetical protein